VLRRLLSLTALSTVLLLLSVGGPHAASAQEQSCQALFANMTLRGQFEATVTHGRDSGWTISGAVVMHVDADGSIDGVLLPPDGSRYTISGRIVSRLLELTFDSGHGVSFSGIGIFPQPCTDPVTGLLIGPRLGDFGHWGIIWGS